MQALTFYGILFLAGGNDVIALKLHLSPQSITMTLRILLFVGPVTAAWVTRRICLSLQRHDRQTVLHGRETGRLVRTAGWILRGPRGALTLATVAAGRARGQRALRHQQPGTLPPTQVGAPIPAASHDVALLLRPRRHTHTATGGSTERRCTPRSGPGGGGTMLQLVKGPCRHCPAAVSPTRLSTTLLGGCEMTTSSLSSSPSAGLWLAVAGLITDEEISSVPERTTIDAVPNVAVTTETSSVSFTCANSPRHLQWSAMVGNSRLTEACPEQQHRRGSATALVSTDPQVAAPDGNRT